ncbi:spore maturation protein A [Pelagirhabdus alkalitolerans]|uniref:Spore maturation protein A n=1 Tax=Pelagirhabdus alkalitolerans TaxID=1612202 RepID=A0A1G6HDZ4_9BACI|nr:nucleoside recognition domain-containing protein [Pelagirhabdus alkalitolerans]SDB91646.1 spore maturation protein A [Pelagirhabdus alkalitolerans]
MIHLIWAGLTCIGIVYALINGTMSDVNQAIFESAEEAIYIMVGLSSLLMFWLGMMKIAEGISALTFLSRLLRPFMVRLFPEIPKEHPALGYITSNFIANVFGLGHAATPLGLKAMQELKAQSTSDEPSRSMITFLVINTSSLTIIPTTVIALRSQFGSNSPTEIVLPTLIATTLSTTAAILIDRAFYYKRVRMNGR